MGRRIPVDRVRVGRVVMGQAEAHHMRDVLRLKPGAEVEVFDAEGWVGKGRLLEVGQEVAVEIEGAAQPPAGMELTIAAAVPKGQRADWMVEKLAELGVARFVPLATARSVVHPEGRGKLERWRRLATQAARQSGSGVMRIDELTRLADAVAAWREQGVGGWCCATEIDGVGLGSITPAGAGWCFVGPEGGWAEDEIARMRAAGLTGVRLTVSILRIETAAIVAAAGLLLDRSAVSADDRRVSNRSDETDSPATISSSSDPSTGDESAGGSSVSQSSPPPPGQ